MGGSELTFTWLKNGNLEVRLDNYLLETFYNTDLAEDLFLQYVCEDPISVQAKKGFTARFPKLIKEGADVLLEENLRTLKYVPTTPKNTKSTYLKSEENLSESTVYTIQQPVQAEKECNCELKMKSQKPMDTNISIMGVSNDILNTLLAKIKNFYLNYVGWTSASQYLTSQNQGSRNSNNEE